MRFFQVAHFVLLGAIILLSACSSLSQTRPVPSSQLEPNAPAQRDALPPLSELDALRGAVAIQGQNIPVTEPTWQQYTAVDGASLLFTPPADALGYAIYRVQPPWGDLLRFAAMGEGPLWLAVADYGAQRWVLAEFVEGTAQIDLTQLINPLSPEGYLYSAVLCNGGDTGRLDTLTLDYDDLSGELGDWGLTAVADEHGITLTWNEQPVDGYRILRSTLAGDEAPYVVGTVTEQHAGGNTFRETVPEDGSGRWVPANNDNGTPADTTDDFPTLAPALDYYYRIAPVIDGAAGPQSPEVTATVPWGERNTAHRQWPDTTNQSGFFGSMIDGRQMTEAQYKWVGEHLVGGMSLLQSELDGIRKYNPDFIGLNTQFAFFSSPTYQTFDNTRWLPGEDWPTFNALPYGEEQDADGAYPYISGHEDWYCHTPAELLPANRVITTADLSWMDLDSQWPQYFSNSSLELLGEDCYDGWLLDSFTIRYSQPWPGGLQSFDDLLGYLRPRAEALTATLAQSYSAHPRAPWVVADMVYGYNLDSYPYDGSDLYDLSDCDAVWLSQYMKVGEDFATGYFLTYAGPNILRWQNQGLPVILTSRDVNGSWAYCTYLLVRGSHTYFEAKPLEFRPGALYYYSVYSYDPGPPLDPAPQAMDDLRVVSPLNPEIYWFQRDFANCSVLLVPEGMFADKDPNDGIYYEQLDDRDYCKVDAQGNVDNEQTWTPVSGIPGYSLSEGAYIIRERPAA